MLETIFGNKSAENTLVYMQSFGKGYASDIARTFKTYPTAINNQLKQFENDGILVSEQIGRTRLYQWNPRNPMVKLLRRFIEDTMALMPEEDLQRIYEKRKRPRRAGKEL